MSEPWQTFVEGLPRFEKPRRAARVGLVCFDMDGVLVRQESSWVAVHEHYGVENTKGLHAFLRGEIDDDEFIRQDVALWRAKHPSITRNDVAQILTRRLQIMPGAFATVRRLHEEGIKTAIVSAGLEPAAAHVAQRLGIPRVASNSLETDDHGRLTGRGRVGTPLRDKSVPLRRFAAELGIALSEVAAVGNSGPDIPMFRASGLGIAFRPTDAHAAQHADVVVRGRSLTGILGPILGRA